MEYEFRKEWLRWVLDFIQMDLSRLSRKEKYKLFREMVYFSSDSFFNTSWELIEKHIEFSHNKLIEWEGIISEIQTVLKDFLNVMTTTRENYELPELTSWMRPEGTMTRDPRVYFQTHSVPKDLTPKNWAVLNLSRLIQGLEMHMIGKCEECQRYFLNFSLRKKRYCSVRCTSRTLARSRKERWTPKEYDAYLKKQRRRSNRWYEKKRKKQGKIVKHRPKKRGKKLSVKVL